MTPIEEKAWSTQQTLLKNGESETDDKVESGSDSDPETEGEEEEPPLPPT